MKKVVLYERVSTGKQEESIDAQKRILKDYVVQNNCEIIKEYVDENQSGQKKKRSDDGYNKLISDIERGLLDDCTIIFTKLDRWYRNLLEFNLANEILKQHNVKWFAVLEPQFNTETAMGKAIVNIVVTLAELEAQQVGERIRTIFENKVIKGEAVTGRQSFGYKIENKKIVKDDEVEEIVEDIFRKFSVCNSIRKTLEYILAKHNFIIGYSTMRKILRNEKYYGKYKTNLNYYPPYITKEEYDRNQKIIDSNIRHSSKQKHDYAFSGLLYCECGGRLTGSYSSPREEQYYYYYRCGRNKSDRVCKCNKCISERKIEDYLLQNIEEYIEKYEYELKVEERKNKTHIDNRKQIKEKQAKLNDLYINDFLTLEEYKAKYNYLESQIIFEEPPKKIDVERIKNIFKDGFEDVYKTLTGEEKQTLWRSVISKINTENGKIVGIEFI